MYISKTSYNIEVMGGLDISGLYRLIILAVIISSDKFIF